MPGTLGEQLATLLLIWLGMPIRSLAVVSETTGRAGEDLEVAIQALQRGPALQLASAVVTKFKARRRFRDMKIYHTENTPQIIEIRDLGFTFGIPEIQTMRLRIPFSTVCCHLYAFAIARRHRCSRQHFFERSPNGLL
jgi:hypothetical protein